MRDPYPRLSPADRMLLSIEDAWTPTHIGALLVLEAPPLLDAAGHLRLEELRLRLARRLRRAPMLRKVLYRPGLLLGPPLWVDDASFDVARHVLHAEIPAPGGEAQLLRLVETLLRAPLQRFLIRRQHRVNLFESDLIGPPVPLFVLGARILEVTIATNLAGTVGLSFAILSYAGQLNLSVCAEAERFPDLEVLVAAMERNWARLSRRHEPVGPGFHGAPA